MDPNLPYYQSSEAVVNENPSTDAGSGGGIRAPHPVLERFYSVSEQRQAVVTGLFNESASHYDRITSMMSFGSGVGYRQNVLRKIGVGVGSRVLDVACGTGQVAAAALQLVGPSGVVIGVDPSDGMRYVAEQRRGLQTLAGTAERLPLEDRSFDVVVMGYALRHVSDLMATFLEMRRVLRPGGTVAILEITPPEGLVARSILKIYLKHIVPPASLLMTRSVPAMRLMKYYWQSIEDCVSPAAIISAMKQAGLVGPERHRTLGIFNEYVAFSPMECGGTSRDISRNAATCPH